MQQKNNGLFNKRKATTGTMIMTIVGATISASLMGITIESGLAYGELFNKETVKTTAERIESGIHALDAVEEGKIEMDLRGNKKYKVYEDEGDAYISYNEKIVENTKPIEEVPGADFTIDRAKGQSGVNKICMEKQGSTIQIEGGSCR
jgi:hypothetical protein